MIQAIRSRLRTVFRRAALEREMRDEVALLQEEGRAARRAAGPGARLARRVALRSASGLTLRDDAAHALRPDGRNDQRHCRVTRSSRNDLN